MNKMQQAQKRVQGNTYLAQVAECDLAGLDQIIQQALAYDGSVNRWRAYEQLKRKASAMVGWGARHRQLATSGHYESMIDFIDWLLPSDCMPDQEECDE